MPTVPTGAKKPQDRKLSAADEFEAVLSDEELLDGLPELKAPNRLRVRDRNKITKMALGLREFQGEAGDYEGWTKAQLLAEIAKRNEAADDDDQLDVKAAAKNEDLVAILEADDKAIHLEADDPRMAQLLDVLADIDEFAESIAIDPEAYVEWSYGKGYEVFTALLSKYSSAVGESSAS